MPTAALLLERLPEFRVDAFTAGLKSLGYDVKPNASTNPKLGDVLVIWNRSMTRDAMARRYEAVGGKVIVAENGYLGREWRGGIWYALALGNHNGAGTWPDGGDDRWDSWGVELEPWRDGGSDVVILAQRGIGHPKVREPHGWSRKLLTDLQASTKRKVRVRAHPGERKPPVSLEDDLSKAWCVVTWGSAAAFKALAWGIPVFHGYPKWIGAGTAAAWPGNIEQPFRGDRLPAFRSLAHAMWGLDEIASGKALRCLLG